MCFSPGLMSLHLTPLVGVLGDELNMRPDGRMKIQRHPFREYETLYMSLPHY